VLFAVLAGLWLRAGRGDRPEYRRSTRLYVAGTAAFAVLMACTALLPASARVPAWGLLDAAYLAVFGAVILTASAGASLIVTDALIERFGTLTIIVLGEILTSVVAGLASQPLGGLTRSAASLHDQVMAGRVSAGARQSVAKDHGSNCVWTETWRDRLGSASMMGRY
jgi:low temperature requirement protein LtrA